MLAARRLSYDQMLWQTPVISLTAQAFLFSIALGHIHPVSRALAALLALACSLASIHLLAKHRYCEIFYSKLLVAYEKEKGLPLIHDRYITTEGIVGLSSYTVWKWLFILFTLVAIAVGAHAIIEALGVGIVIQKSAAIPAK